MIPVAPRDPALVAQPTDEPPRWLLALERAHALAHKAARALESAPPSEADLRIPVRTIASAITAIYSAHDRREDPLAATRRAQNDLTLAAEQLDPLAADDPVLGDAAIWLRDAWQTLTVAEERFARTQAEPPEPPLPLKASNHLPTLHRLTRAPIPPDFRVAEPLSPPPEPPPPLPPPKTLDELTATMAEVKRRAEERKQARNAREQERKQAEQDKRAKALLEPPPGFARGPFKALTTRELIVRRARECFDEVAMIGLQRSPLLGDPWRSAQVLEDRMLAAVDAIAALGKPALDSLEAFVRDAPAKDPSRGFAIAMVLGCIHGRDAIGAIERALYHLDPGDPAVSRYLGGALKLVPHPELPLSLRTLLTETDPAMRAFAIDVLAYRALAHPDELVRAAHDPMPGVAVPALPALAQMGSTELAEAIELARNHQDPSLREASWTAMLLSGHPHASYVLLHELEGPLADRAALPLAIVADADDAAKLETRIRRAPRPTLVTALGWTGSITSIPLLLELLTSEDPALQIAAAEALERITAAGLYEEVDVPPEEIDVPAVEDPAGVEDEEDKSQRPLAQVIGSPRDIPSQGASDTIIRPSIDVDRWNAYWIERGESFTPGLKYRRGNPYTPLVSLWELDVLALTPVERRWLGRELCVRTGAFVRFDPHDFVAVQETALAAWQPIAQRMSGSPGSWGIPRRR